MMKRWIVGFAAVSLCALMWSCAAQARGLYFPRNAVYHQRDLSFLAVGAAVEEEQRKMDAAESFTFEARNAYGFVAVDVAPWATVLGGLGISEAETPDSEQFDDDGDMWFAAINATFWEHYVTEPEFLACRAAISASAGYWDREAEREDGAGVAWEEVRLAAVVSAEFFVEPRHDEHAVPYSLLLFAGPIFSDLDVDADQALTGGGAGNAVGYAYEAEEEVGLVAGADVKLAWNLSIGYEARAFDKVSHNLTLAFHF